MERVVKDQVGVEVVESSPFIADSGKYMRMPGRPNVQLVVFGYRVTKWRGYVDASNGAVMESGWFTYGEAKKVLNMRGDD